MTPNDLYTAVSDIREDVAYIKAKVEAIPDHEQRIRFLERWKWGLPATVVTSVLALIGVLVFHAPIAAIFTILTFL